MIRRLLAALAAVTALALPAAALAQPAPVPESAEETYAPFLPLIGKTWRGEGTGDEPVEDIQRWEWAVGGHAVRVTHSVNGGVYGGETLIFWDKDSGRYIFHYFTSGGFHTTGTIRTPSPGRYDIEETVHGVEDLEALRSNGTIGVDGVYRVRSRVEKDGEWVQSGGFDYREDPTAKVVMPMMAGQGADDEEAQEAGEAAASAGPLDLTRRLVRGVDEAGQDVAGYLRVRNGSPVADALIRVSCDCAERVEMHRIVRAPQGASMQSDEAWVVPGNGALDVRPGSDLHLMLISFDPTEAVDGKVSMTLEFRDGGEVTADFELVEDSRAAWQAFD